LKFLFSGNFRFAFYEAVCVESLEQLGHTVIRFEWPKYFASWMGRIEEKWTLDWLCSRNLNGNLIDEVERHRPDVVLIWRGTHVRREALNIIREICSPTLVSYNNDNPFSHAYRTSGRLDQRRLWRLFLRSLPEYDINLVYRPANLADYRGAGGRNVFLLPPYFVPAIHRPIPLPVEDQRKYGCDIAFVGHYETDCRVEMMRALSQSGLRIRVYGNGWSREIVRTIDHNLSEPYPVFGIDYAKALCGAKVCLSFLSRLNQDVYTRRTFEIPACGRLMLSERTPELKEIFAEDLEAVYFSSIDELVSKARRYVEDDAGREAIARAGLKRCWNDEHDVVSRMRQVVEYIEQAKRG
jgi:spore maturation protein CgeB